MNISEEMDLLLIESMTQGNVITNEEQVNAELISHLRSLEILDTEPKYDKSAPFSALDNLNEDTMLTILERMSTDKAIAYDGVSDSLFKKEHRQHTAKKTQAYLANSSKS